MNATTLRELHAVINQIMEKYHNSPAILDAPLLMVPRYTTTKVRLQVETSDTPEVWVKITLIPKP